MKGLTKLMIVTTVAVAILLVAAPGVALAHTGGNDFVCPVLVQQAVGDHNPNAVPIGGGHYTVAPAGAQHLSVPDQATNMGGTGTPPGTHAMPGDTNYTAIWNGSA